MGLPMPSPSDHLPPPPSSPALMQTRAGRGKGKGKGQGTKTVVAQPETIPPFQSLRFLPPPRPPPPPSRPIQRSVRGSGRARDKGHAAADLPPPPTLLHLQQMPPPLTVAPLPSPPSPMPPPTVAASAKRARDCSALRTVQSRRNCLKQQSAAVSSAELRPPSQPSRTGQTERARPPGGAGPSQSAEGGGMWPFARVCGAVLLLVCAGRATLSHAAARAATRRPVEYEKLSDATRARLSAPRRAVY